MATVLKYILAAFMMTGFAISLSGGWEILSTVNLIQSAPERTKGIFTDYDRMEVRSRSLGTTPFGQLDDEETTSFMSYPEFEFVAKDGQTRHVLETKQHLIRYFQPGQEVEVILSPRGDHRLAGFYSLYFRDICILAMGLCFVLIPFIIWRVAIPSLETQEGRELGKKLGAEYERFFAQKIGPITIRTLLAGGGIFMAMALVVALSGTLSPYLKQMRLGFGYGLIEAIEQERFDEARDLIMKRKGIDSVTEHDQRPLHLALEKGRPDLARLIIEAGADVNVQSKMIYRTPLEMATQSGDIKMVKLLLSKGALPDGENDETPPVFIAIMKGHDEIARILIESGCDLKRQYVSGNNRFTVGDWAVMARKPALADLVRRHNGVFTRSP